MHGNPHLLIEIPDESIGFVSGDKVEIRLHPVGLAPQAVSARLLINDPLGATVSTEDDLHFAVHAPFLEGDKHSAEILKDGGDRTLHRVDYDRIARFYDEPCRDHVADPNLTAYLADRPSIDRGRLRVLDVGCGTGKQLAANREVFPKAVLIGLDRFQGMLDVARRRCPPVRWVQGDGACLPFASGSVDYVTNQFSYPHIRDKEGLFRELYRVLRPGGRFVMTNIDPWSMPDWIIYRFFPAALALDHKDFLTADRFAAGLREAGFTDIRTDRKRHRPRQRLSNFLDYASRRHSASQFMAIADRDYESGLATIREAIARSQDDAPDVASEVCVITIRADRPER